MAGSSPRVLGSTTPRLWTPPLVTGPPGPCGCGCALTPNTSVGFDWTEFASDAVHRPFDPWQRWTAIHGGELLPDGRPRFRFVWVIVGRQNGKTELPVLLSGYWLFVQQVPMILGTSTKLDYAKESWQKVVNLINKSDDPDIVRQRPSKKWWRDANGEQECWTESGSRYKIAASNEEGGRSLTVDRLIMDEIRQHHDYSAWGAAEGAMTAVYDAQAWCLSNAGDARSVVLNEARDAALEFIRTGIGDWRTGWFEYSAPADSDPTDIRALAQANPNLGRRIDPEALLLEATKAKRRGGQMLTTFRTEKMCIAVESNEPAIDAEGWKAGYRPGDMAGLRSRVVLTFDVAMDSQHATLIAAATLPNGAVRGEVVAAWSAEKDGEPEGGGMDVMIADVKRWIVRIRPRKFGWLPNGPAAAYAAELRPEEGAKRPRWLPAGTDMVEIKTDLPTVCMGFGDLIKGGKFLHGNDPLLNAHSLGAQKLYRANGVWVLSRKGGHVDAAYAAAGATHLARTLPAPVGRPRLIVVGDDEV